MYVIYAMIVVDFVDETGSTEWDGNMREASAGYLPQAAVSLHRTSPRCT